MKEKHYLVSDYHFGLDEFTNCFDFKEYQFELCNSPYEKDFYARITELAQKRTPEHHPVELGVMKMPEITELELLNIQRLPMCKVKKDNNYYFYQIDVHGSIRYMAGVDLDGNQFDNIQPNDAEVYGNVGNISSEAQKQLRTNPNFYLIFNYHWEGIVGKYELFLLHRQLKSYGIPFNKVILVFGGYNQNKWMKSMMSYYYQDSHINFVYKNWCFKTKAEEYRMYYKQGLWNKISRGYTIQKRKYDFNCLNRRLHAHRLYCLGRLHTYGLVEKNIVTYDFKSKLEDNKIQTTDLEKKLDDEWMDMRFVKKYLVDLKENRPTFTYDFEDLDSLFGINWETSKVYDDSMFTLVNETSALNGQYYISEKIMKPIGHCHPFLVFGTVGSLKHLREHGFKTFEPYIDESYDNIKKAEDRFEAILIEIRRLCDMDSDEKLKWMKSVSEICEYNRNHLFRIADNYNKVMGHRFLRKLKKIINV